MVDRGRFGPLMIGFVVRENVILATFHASVISLMLNPNEDEHNTLRILVRKSIEEAIAGKSTENTVADLMQASRSVLKDAWEQIKNLE